MCRDLDFAGMIRKGHAAHQPARPLGANVAEGVQRVNDGKCQAKGASTAADWRED